MDEILPLDRIGSFLDGLEKKRQERICSVCLVAVEVAQNGKGYHTLWYGKRVGKAAGGDKMGRQINRLVFIHTCE